jgi:hypothetical protein
MRKKCGGKTASILATGSARELACILWGVYERFWSSSFWLKLSVLILHEILNLLCKKARFQEVAKLKNLRNVLLSPF